MNPPNPPDEVYFTLAGPIDDLLAQRLFNSFAIATQQKVKKVHLLVQSAGGHVGSGIAIYNFLKGIPLEVVTYNCGAVYSIAVIVFLAGHTRIASPHASFMIHKTTASLNFPIGIDSIRTRAESIELDDKNTEDILREHIEMPDSKWDIHRKADLTISATDALDFKIVHQLGSFQVPQGGQLYNL